MVITVLGRGFSAPLLPLSVFYRFIRLYYFEESLPAFFSYFYKKESNFATF
jgi:hypothetical protein